MTSWLQWQLCSIKLSIHWKAFIYRTFTITALKRKKFSLYHCAKCVNSSHVINIDVIVIIKFNKVDRWLSLNLINNCAGLLWTIRVLILHLLSYKTVKNFTSLFHFSGVFCKREKVKAVKVMCIFTFSVWHKFFPKPDDQIHQHVTWTRA